MFAQGIAIFATHALHERVQLRVTTFTDYCSMALREKPCNVVIVKVDQITYKQIQSSQIIHFVTPDVHISLFGGCTASPRLLSG